LHLQQDMSGRVYKPKGTYCLHKKQQQKVLMDEGIIIS